MFLSFHNSGVYPSRFTDLPNLGLCFSLSIKQRDRLYIRHFDRAQTTIDFVMCWSNWPIETFLLKYSDVV